MTIKTPEEQMEHFKLLATSLGFDMTPSKTVTNWFENIHTSGAFLLYDMVYWDAVQDGIRSNRENTTKEKYHDI
jgi:hypothetical protein